MNDYNLNYLALLERERNTWRTKYFDLLYQVKKLFFAFLIVMLLALFAMANLIWLSFHG